MTAVKDVQKDSLKSAVEHRIVHGALPDIPDWLNNAERMMAEFEAIRWGNMAVGSGLVGEVITNETILDRLPAGTTDEERLLARKTLEYSGVTTRYRSPPLSETRDLHAVMDDTGRITAHLLDRLIKAYGRKPDHIIVTSLSLPPDVNDFIKGYANLESATDSSVRTACSGGLIAEAIAMTNPEFPSGISGQNSCYPLCRTDRISRTEGALHKGTYSDAGDIHRCLFRENIYSRRL